MSNHKPGGKSPGLSRNTKTVQGRQRHRLVLDSDPGVDSDTGDCSAAPVSSWSRRAVVGAGLAASSTALLGLSPRLPVPDAVKLSHRRIRPGGTVVVASASADEAWLVRVHPDGRHSTLRRLRLTATHDGVTTTFVTPRLDTDPGLETFVLRVAVTTESHAVWSAPLEVVCTALVPGL